jgi:hypothetical protein
MDITNIPQNLIKALEQKNTEQLAVLSRVLNLVLGKTLIASVTATAPVTPPERAELLKQTAAALAQLNQQSIEKLTPAVKIEIARLIQQQNLIQTPELKWINLVVNNRPLLTYSDRPLTPGQTIPVQLQSPQKLVLLDLPEFDSNKLLPGKAQTTAPGITPLTNNAANITQLLETKNALAVNELLKNVIAALSTKTIPTPTNLTQNVAAVVANVISQKLLIPDVTTNKETQAKTLAPDMLIPTVDTNSKAIQQNKVNLYSEHNLSLKLSTQAESKLNNPETTAAKNLVSEQLRNILPHKDTPSILLAAAVQLQNLPATTRLQFLSPSVEQALKSLAERIRSPEQITQPKLLAQTLKNSGIFFENKLSYLTPKEAAEPRNSSNTLNNTYSLDLKGSLLTLLNRVTQELGGGNKPISSEQTLKLFQNLGSGALLNQIPNAALELNSKSDITQSLGLLIQELMQKPAKELSNKELRTQLLVLLQQHCVHSLAKIQLQQLHSVNHELETKDTNAPNASWQLEIPVKHHNDVHHLHLRIDREWVDEKNESESDKSTHKVKQWSVTLRFDLPTLGEFCAQLAIVNTQVSATLWAAREKTFTEVREHSEDLRKQLESEGINVKYLQCMRGMPPQKPMALSYSLIDIST